MGGGGGGGVIALLFRICSRPAVRAVMYVEQSRVVQARFSESVSYHTVDHAHAFVPRPCVVPPSLFPPSFLFHSIRLGIIEMFDCSISEQMIANTNFHVPSLLPPLLPPSPS